jgi:hypothetical protein
MRLLPTLALSLLALTVLSCSESTEPEPKPTDCFGSMPQCYFGVIVGDACLDGVLIDVDAAFPIGKPAAGRSNVIAAVNVADFSSLNQVGQRVYFQYRNDPAQQSPNRACTTNTMPLPVPHLVLNNLAAVACAPGSTGSR